MSWFKKNKDPYTPFSRNEAVMALADLPGVPAGTGGRVKMSNGLDWLRYWVFFDNGVQLGQIDSSFLARPKDRVLLQEELDARNDARTVREAEYSAQQNELLDLLLNPPPEPEPDSSEESAEAFQEAPEEAADDGELDDGEPADGGAVDNGTANDESAEQAASAPAAPAAAAVSQGSALVDIPEHLLQRSAEARSRLAE